MITAGTVVYRDDRESVQAAAGSRCRHCGAVMLAAEPAPCSHAAWEATTVFVTREHGSRLVLAVSATAHEAVREIRRARLVHALVPDDVVADAAE